LYIVIATFS